MKWYTPPRRRKAGLQNFQQTVKIYEQNKKYYDALRKVNKLVRDARKVQRCMLLVGEISDIYVDGTAASSPTRTSRSRSWRPSP